MSAVRHSAARLAALGLMATAIGCARGGVARAPVPVRSPGMETIHSPSAALRLIRYRHVRDQRIPGGALVCAGGDVMLGSNLDAATTGRASRSASRPGLPPSPDSLLAPLRPLVADADVVLVNVEGAIGTGPAGRKCRPGGINCYAFRQEPAAARALRSLAPLGEVAGNVANNHAGDAGPAGFQETISHLREAGVGAVGADTVPVLMPLPDGDTLAVLGFSTFSGGADARDLEGVRRRVAAVAARYRRVIVSVHMGAEGVGAQRTSDAEEMFLGEDRGNPVAFARAAVEGGATVVFGHGPHVLRAIEWLGGSLVIYSLGNLLTFGPFSMSEPLNRGGFACVMLSSRGRVLSADFRATRQERPGLVVPDASERAWELIDSLSALDFPTTGARVVDGRVVRATAH